MHSPRGESRCGHRRGPRRSTGCWRPASLGPFPSSSSMSGHDESGKRPVLGATHFQNRWSSAPASSVTSPTSSTCLVLSLIHVVYVLVALDRDDCRSEYHAFA